MLLAPVRWLKRAVLAVFGLLLLYQFWLFGWVLWWKWVDPDTTRFMDIRLAELRVKKPDFELEKAWVDYRNISIHLKRALIVSEDD